MKDLITIAVASYNNGKYIDRCLDTVINQSYTNLDIIIVDDGSTDNTLSVCKKYISDSRIRIIVKENGGLSSVRQRALNEANGSFICFIDADDYLEPFYIDKMFCQMQIDKSDICICSTIVENEEGIINQKDTNAFLVQELSPMKLSQESLSRNFSKLSSLLSMSDSWNKMYRISFIKDSGVCFVLPKGFNGTDLVFNHKLALHTPQYSFVNTSCYHHVLYTRSAVHRKKKELQNGFEYIFSDIVDETKKVNTFDLMKGIIVNLHFYFLRYAIQDIMEETNNICKKLVAIHHSKNQESKYIEQYTFLKGKLDYMETRSLKLFYLLYRYFPLALPVFSYIRKIFIK